MFEVLNSLCLHVFPLVFLLLAVYWISCIIVWCYIPNLNGYVICFSPSFSSSDTYAGMFNSAPRSPWLGSFSSHSLHLIVLLFYLLVDWIISCATHLSCLAPLLDVFHCSSSCSSIISVISFYLLLLHHAPPPLPMLSLQRLT